MREKRSQKPLSTPTSASWDWSPRGNSKNLPAANPGGKHETNPTDCTTRAGSHLSTASGATLSSHSSWSSTASSMPKPLANSLEQAPTCFKNSLRSALAHRGRSHPDHHAAHCRRATARHTPLLDASPVSDTSWYWASSERICLLGTFNVGNALHARPDFCGRKGVHRTYRSGYAGLLLAGAAVLAIGILAHRSAETNLKRPPSAASWSDFLVDVEVRATDWPSSI